MLNKNRVQGAGRVNQGITRFTRDPWEAKLQGLLASLVIPEREVRARLRDYSLHS